MAKFLDKKEQVIDFQLTPYGKHRLSLGQLKPAYYAFFDTGVTYDSEYAGFKESQTTIHERIKNNTQFLEGILLFEEAENSVPDSEFEGDKTYYGFRGLRDIGLGGSRTIRADRVYEYGTMAYNYAQYGARVVLGSYLGRSWGDTSIAYLRYYGYIEYLYESTSLFDLDVVPKKHVPTPNILSFESAIGDAKFEGENTQHAPAWKLLTCQGEITNVETKDTSKYNFTSANFDNEVKEFNIPQIDVRADYTIEISSPTEMLEEEVPSDFISETKPFLGGNTIKLIRNDVMVYAEEVNTQLLTENFDVEVFEMVEDAGITVEATLGLRLSATDVISIGDKITIGDGITAETFEFIGPDPTDTVTEVGNIGVAVPSAYHYNNVNINNKGTILNLISAIRQDGGNPIPEVTCVNPGCRPRTASDTIADYEVGQYPSPNYRGTDNSIPKKLFTPATNRGRCKKDYSETGGCYKGTHNLKIDIPMSAVREVMDHDFSADSYTLILTNKNTSQGNPNQPASTTAASGRIQVLDGGFTGGYTAKGVELKRKYFVDEIPQIVDGLMMSATEKKPMNVNFDEDSVEYFFSLLTDKQVNDKIACSCASTFNRNSYYIDVDFDCTEEDLEVSYYDIYGSATSPEICSPPDTTTQTRPEELVPPPDICEDE